jgi:hypothetical protein
MQRKRVAAQKYALGQSPNYRKDRLYFDGAAIAVASRIETVARKHQAACRVIEEPVAA